MNQIMKIEDPTAVVQEWKGDLVAAMSPDVDKDKFISAVITALTINPDIAKECTPESIKNACVKAAYDGLRPDGREGALVKYNTKVKRDGREVWESQAQWMPMVYGVRKKAKDHDGVIITANVVHKNDKFHRTAGDEERIEHEPAPLGVDPGPIVGFYAIFRNRDGEILHREVMSRQQVDAIRQVSKSSNGPAWSKFYEEMGKKCVVRRGVKSVPLSDRVETVIRRDDSMYDFNGPTIEADNGPSVMERLAGREIQRIEGFSQQHVEMATGQKEPEKTIDNEPADDGVSGGEPMEVQDEPDHLPEHQGSGERPYAPALYQECADKFLSIARDGAMSAEAKLNKIAAVKDAWKGEMPNDLDFVKVCLSTAEAIAKGKQDAGRAKVYLYSLRGIEA